MLVTGFPAGAFQTNCWLVATAPGSEALVVDPGQDALDGIAPLADGQVVELAGLRLVVDHTPGHTPGHVTFRSEAGGGEPGRLLAGDLVFAGSIGRTDLPGGDTGQMLASLAARFLPLPDDTVVLPGHGPTTTVGRERATNPFLQGIRA